LRILFYHRVSDDRDELAVTPKRFREQMEYLAGEGYRVVDVVGAADLLDAGEIPPKTVALSFDDGCLDVAEHALPVLAEHGFRATVFVAPAVTDGTASFSWYEEQPPLIGWDEMVELDRQGTLGFEAHSLTHPNLPALDDGAVRHEIAGSKEALEKRLGRPVQAFSYPSGLYGEREEKVVAEAGFRVAVSCEPGVNDSRADRFALRRRQVDARDTLLDFRAKLGGGHDSPPPLRGLYRHLRYGAETAKPRRASSVR
jgi:peptidoglycan/xylan/chitin deacetylase (PgdA/CDA1 family)